MKWNFKTQDIGYDSQGIRDGDIEIFDKDRYGSVIRESIQNSLDAVLNKNVPVTVKFNFDKIQKAEHPELFAIESRLEACKTSSENEDDKELIERMQEGIDGDSVEILTISDYNTKGMLADSTYLDFAMGRNSSSKQDKSSQGSKGMGKAAYFCLSPIRTILVHSKYYEGGSLFQGVSRLATHKIEEQSFYYKGFYSSKDYSPDAEVYDDAPMYERSDPGTSICVIGLWEDEWRNYNMERELLNSFWLAIAEGKLEVEIDEKVFNKETLEAHIDELWEEDEESGHYNANGNPKPYYRTFIERPKVSKVYESKDLAELGKLKLHLAKSTGFPPRIAFFRQSRMLIYKQNLLYKDYCGVLICDDEKGNETLKRMENAVHNEWNPKNWKNDRAKVAKKELDDFIDKCKLDFLGANDSEELTLPGLEEFINLGGKTKVGTSTGSTNGKAKVVTREKTERPDPVPKPLKQVIIYADHVGEEVSYQVVLESTRVQNDFQFELIAGSDNDAITKDDKLLIAKCSNGSIDKNIVTTNLIKGVNRISVTTQDTEPQSIYLKKVNYEI